MVAKQAKPTKRAFVMTGGGAKGLFEAGVIHAFHLCGMEFDAITGSSIGAINSIVYAEYQLRKRQLPPEILADPEQALEAMDPLLWAFMHAWWDLPRMGIIDDSATGPLGMLKDDLLGLDVSLPSIVRILWWYTDSANDKVPDLKVLADITNLANEVPERLAGGRGIVEIWQRWREDGTNPFDAAVRTYLNRFGMEHSLVPDDKADNLKEYFTQSISPLTREHLENPEARQDADPQLPLIPADRTLRDFKESGIDVRLTRTNFRTGRLEVSAYNTAEQFAAFLKKHWYRFDTDDGLLPALGTARLQTIGNPNAIQAALASGRFPGVFSPVPIHKIYDLDTADDAENVLFSGFLAQWLNNDEVRAALSAAAGGPSRYNQAISDELLQAWRDSEELERLFPRASDEYVDGGAIDNTPTNSAIDAIKDWADERNIGYRDVQLDLYTIFLHPPPDPGELITQTKPSSIETVRRTMEIRTAAVLDTDAAHVRYINKAGQVAEDTARSLIEMAAGIEETLDLLETDSSLALSDEQRAVLAAALEARFSAALPAAGGGTFRQRLAELKAEQKQIIDHKLPLHVNPIEIHPEEMPMRTLQFTERLGYRRENAIRMMSSGCYSTLWSLYAHLSRKAQQEGLDTQDESVLRMACRWMGLDRAALPPATTELRKRWRCQRVTCVYYERHCPHGAAAKAD